MINPFSRLWSDDTSMANKIKEAAATYEQPASETFNDDGYTIGFVDGYTVMKLKSGYTTMTLRMLPNDVRRLIRLLEASLDDDLENETDE